MGRSGWEMLWRILDTRAVYLAVKMIYMVGRKFFPEEFVEAE